MKSNLFQPKICPAESVTVFSTKAYILWSMWRIQRDYKKQFAELCKKENQLHSFPQYMFPYISDYLFLLLFQYLLSCANHTRHGL